MIAVGNAARELRDLLGLSQKDAAEELGITNVHLCNIEKGNSQPSPDLLAKYREAWGVDLYVFAWCQAGSVTELPKPLRSAAQDLAAGWEVQIKKQISKRRAASR